MDEKILQERVKNLLFYHNLLRKSLGAKITTVEEIIAELEPVRELLLSYAHSAFEISRKISACKAVMFEGAQGALLDVTYGTFPFVTSSNTMAGQVTLGSCLGVDELHKTIGILKAYTTRVGSGPFPTELNDEIGKFLRIEGNEVGTVTGRDRRCGWFDAVLVRQAIQLSSVKEIALTKIDVLDKLEKIQICTAYKIDGRLYDYLPQANHLWEKIEPVYEEIEGWKQSTVGAKSLEELPLKARAYIARIEELCGVKAAIISTGPKREETILV
jgi:adenylosuccinate synthase